MKRSYLLISVLPLIFSVQTTMAHPMISENHQDIIKRAVDKVQTTEKIQNYL